MKKYILSLLTVSLSYLAIAQGTSDRITKVDGSTIEGTVVEIDDKQIKYQLVGQKALRSLSTLAISEITYANGSKESIPNRFDGFKDEGYASGMYITKDSRDIAGLTEVGRIFSKARATLLVSPVNNVNNRALRKLKLEAEFYGADVLLIQESELKHDFGDKLQTYSAVAYALNPRPSLEIVNDFITANKLYVSSMSKFRRSLWFSTDNKETFDVAVDIDDVEAVGNKVFMQVNYPGNEIINWEVVSIKDNMVTLLNHDGKVASRLILTTK